MALSLSVRLKAVARRRSRAELGDRPSQVVKLFLDGEAVGDDFRAAAGESYRSPVD